MVIKETCSRIGKFFARYQHHQGGSTSVSSTSLRHDIENDCENQSRHILKHYRRKGKLPYQKFEDNNYNRIGVTDWHLGSRPQRHRFRNPFQNRCVTWLVVALALSVAFLMYELRVERVLNRRWRPDADTIAFSKKPLGSPPQHIDKIIDFELPLHTQGRNIVDVNNERFKLASVNWQGANDRSFVVGGLNLKHRSEIAETIKLLGFNSVRLSYTTEMVTTNPIVDSKLLSQNRDLIGKAALEVLEATTKSLTDAGLGVIISHHETGWCCSAGLCNAGWLGGYFGSICRSKQTEQEWIENWEKIMLPYLHNPFVIGCDLGSKAYGSRGESSWSEWAATAEIAGNRLLRMNPDWLIIVEGINEASDLSGARERPVTFDEPNKLVYSAHVCSARACGASVWGDLYSHLVQSSYMSFASKMSFRWGYLVEEDIAPLWVGELDASHSSGLGSRRYWGNLLRYMKQVDTDFAYSTLNTRPSKTSPPESYALLGDDYATPILDYRLKDMRELMSQ